MKQIPHEFWPEIRPHLEDAPMGQFDKRLDACIDDLFADIRTVAARMMCCQAVALREVRKASLRRISWGRRVLYLNTDVDRVIQQYKEQP